MSSTFGRVFTVWSNLMLGGQRSLEWRDRMATCLEVLKVNSVNLWFIVSHCNSNSAARHFNKSRQVNPIGSNRIKSDFQERSQVPKVPTKRLQGPHLPFSSEACCHKGAVSNDEGLETQTVVEETWDLSRLDPMYWAVCKATKKADCRVVLRLWIARSSWGLW